LRKTHLIDDGKNDFDIAATQFHRPDFLIPSLRGNFFRGRQLCFVLANQSALSPKESKLPTMDFVKTEPNPGTVCAYLTFSTSGARSFVFLSGREFAF
jgi:hypothetical protein